MTDSTTSKPACPLASPVIIMKMFLKIAFVFLLYLSAGSLIAQRLSGEEVKKLALARWTVPVKTWVPEDTDGMIYENKEKADGYHQHVISHPYLPLGTLLKVSHPKTGIPVEVEVVDNSHDNDTIYISELVRDELYLTSGRGSITLEIIGAYREKFSGLTINHRKEVMKVFKEYAQPLTLSEFKSKEKPVVVPPVTEPPVATIKTPTGKGLSGKGLSTWTVQVLATRNKEQAEQYKEALNKDFKNVMIASQNNLYRVIVDRSESKTAMEQLKEVLLTKGYKGLVKRYEQTQEEAAKPLKDTTATPSKNPATITTPVKKIK